MYLKYSIDLQSTQEKRDKEKKRKREKKQAIQDVSWLESMHALYTWLFLTIAARVPIFGFTAYSIYHDFILFDVYIQWKKKEEKRCDGNATRSRCALHTRATHARIRMRAHIHIGARAHC